MLSRVGEVSSLMVVGGGVTGILHSQTHTLMLNTYHTKPHNTTDKGRKIRNIEIGQVVEVEESYERTFKEGFRITERVLNVDAKPIKPETLIKSGPL